MSQFLGQLALRKLILAGSHKPESESGSWCSTPGVFMSASNFLPSCGFYIKIHLKLSNYVILTKVICELNLLSWLSCNEVNMRERGCQTEEGNTCFLFCVVVSVSMFRYHTKKVKMDHTVMWRITTNVMTVGFARSVSWNRNLYSRLATRVPSWTHTMKGKN